MPNDNLVSQASDATFKETVLKSGLPVFVDFWAPWCGPCHQLTPIFEDLASEYKGRVRFVRVNVDKAPQIVSSLGIMSIPTIALFHHGKPINGQVGVQPKTVFSGMLDAALLATSESRYIEEQTK